MLEGIRKKRNSLLILLVLGAIIVVFIFWGIGPTGDGGGGGSVVATVNREAIGLKDYLGFYKRQTEYYRETYKDQFTDEMARSLDFKYQTLNIMINRVLALKAADDAGIKVSEEEVRGVIMGMQAFSRDGIFNEEQYFKTLSANRITPSEFEESIRSDIIADKMRHKVTAAVSVTPEEVKKAYFDEFRMVDLAYIEISGERFSKSVRVTDEEAKAYLDESSSEFVVPAQVRAFYAHAPYDDFTKMVKVTDTEIKGFYERFPERFSRPEEVRARHILIRPEYKGKDRAEDEAEAKKKADEVLELVKRGEDFGALAKRLSDDPGSAQKGGDLGWFARGVMIKPFEDTAFSLEAGSLSGVVKTEFGYHIIKVGGAQADKGGLRTDT
jgi:peptidyl-prolyl cis-trans isomerase D